jgi:predicted HTH domain antitoxin
VSTVSANELEPIEKYFLLLLYATDSTQKFAQPIRGKTWLQKQMFLLSKIVPSLADETDYNAYIMGSYSGAVEEIEDQFHISGFTERTADSIRLSLDGKKLAEEAWNSSSQVDRDIVKNVKTLLNDLPYYELLALVYNEFPDSAINSEKRDEVNKNRVALAIGLLRKGKVPTEVAAAIAGKSTHEFLNMLKAKHVHMAGIESASILQDHEIMEQIKRSQADSQKRRLVSWNAIKKAL